MVFRVVSVWYNLLCLFYNIRLWKTLHSNIPLKKLMLKFTLHCRNFTQYLRIKFDPGLGVMVSLVVSSTTQEIIILAGRPLLNIQALPKISRASDLVLPAQTLLRYRSRCVVSTLEPFCSNGSQFCPVYCHFNLQILWAMSMTLVNRSSH